MIFFHVQNRFYHFSTHHAEIALSISGLQMTATYLGILLMPAVFGFLAQWISTGLFPAYLLLMVLLTGFSVVGLRKSLGR